MKGEYIAMRLATLAGLSAAPVELVRAAGKDVLLVERFDRVAQGGTWKRLAMVSALTILELDEMQARYASYQDLAEKIRFRFVEPTKTLHELFARLTLNVLVGNVDDHARNHAAFWDGSRLRLTPAYDICPQARSGEEASQAMLINGQQRSSQIATCLAAASHFHLAEDGALAIVSRQVETIATHWVSLCDEAKLGRVDRALFLGPPVPQPLRLLRARWLRRSPRGVCRQAIRATHASMTGPPDGTRRLWTRGTALPIVARRSAAWACCLDCKAGAVRANGPSWPPGRTTEHARRSRRFRGMARLRLPRTREEDR